MLRTLYFLALMLTAIAMSLAMAHLFELPNKIDISADHYLIVQRDYDNWAVIGVMVEAGGLLPSSMGARVRLAGGKVTVMDGPWHAVPQGRAPGSRDANQAAAPVRSANQA